MSRDHNLIAQVFDRFTRLATRFEKIAERTEAHLDRAEGKGPPPARPQRPPDHPAACTCEECFATIRFK